MILVAALFAALIVVGIITNRRAATKKAGGTGKFRKGTFKRRAARLGLSKVQIKALEFVIDRYKVRNPYSLLTNSPQLDMYLKKAIQGIDEQVSQDQTKEAQKLTLYRIKQIVERNSERSGGFSNSRQLQINQNVALTTESGAQFKSRVLSVLRDAVAVEVPVDETGAQVRWRKWSPLTVFFWKGNGEGYSFESKITGYNTLKGSAAAFLQHSNKITKAKQRQYRRRELDRPCYFYPVRIITAGSGKNQTKKAFVETKRGSLGTVIEVSAGGCSIRATRGLATGALIKVDFETFRGNPVSSYGKVVNAHKDETEGQVMHVMFTKLSRSNLNNINSFVYDFVH
ncbi:MAG: PilZ domain-containing protein [Spirochaetales bacterium]|nr:PilZ domain-containing protein [Spirochaetales bacterium]